MTRYCARFVITLLFLSPRAMLPAAAHNYVIAGLRHGNAHTHAFLFQHVQKSGSSAGEAKGVEGKAAEGKAVEEGQHRSSCHRCGNLRRKNVFCQKCPHIFCQK